MKIMLVNVCDDISKTLFTRGGLSDTCFKRGLNCSNIVLCEEGRRYVEFVFNKGVVLLPYFQSLR